MTGQQPRRDLSTERILESIGRIVSEGERGADGPRDRPPPAAAPTPEADDDVLDLVDMVDEQGNAIPPGRRPEGADGGAANEERMTEILRPMLEIWLDTHGPQVVERLVRREIERAARRARPG